MDCPFYSTLNKSLRDDDESDLTAYAPFLKLLMQAITKLQKEDSIFKGNSKDKDCLYRGVPVDLVQLYEKVTE